MFRLFIPVVFVSLLANIASAQEQEDGYPANYVQRPLTMPARTLRIDGFGQLARIGQINRTEGTINLGVGYGIVDDFEVGLSGERIGERRGAGMVLLHIGPDAAGDTEVEFGNMLVYGRYRFFETDVFEMGGELSLQIPTRSDFGLSVALPYRLRLGEMFSIDGSFVLSAAFRDEIDGGNTVVLDFVVQPRFAPADRSYVGINTGAIVGELTEQNFVVVPLGFEVGLVAGSATTRVDVFAEFAFPTFHFSGRTVRVAFGDVSYHDRSGQVVTENWSLTLGARVYLGFER